MTFDEHWAKYWGAAISHPLTASYSEIEDNAGRLRDLVARKIREIAP